MSVKKTVAPVDLPAGRGRAECGRYARFADPAARDSIPDPNAQSSLEAGKIDWSRRGRQPPAAWLALYSDLLRRRRASLVPWLAGARSGTPHLTAPWSVRVALEQP